jgi:transposase
MAAQTFKRWSRHGVWERLLQRAQRREGVKRGMAFLDGTTIRAHQKAAGAAKKGGLLSASGVMERIT